MLRKVTKLILAPYKHRLLPRNQYRAFINKSDNITFSVFDGQNINIVKSVLINDFTLNKEPLCYQISARNFAYFVEPYIRNARKEKSSIIAKVDDVVAGIALNNDFAVQEDEKFIQELKKRDYFAFDMLFQLINDVRNDFKMEMTAKDLLKPGNIFRLMLVGVDPHFSQQGYATGLTKESINKAKEMGYKYVTTASTNDHMTYVAQKCGMQCINSIQYAQWEYPKGSGIYPKKAIEEITGFKEMSFMVKKLD